MASHVLSHFIPIISVDFIPTILHLWWCTMPFKHIVSFRHSQPNWQKRMCFVTQNGKRQTTKMDVVAVESPMHGIDAVM